MSSQQSSAPRAPSHHRRKPRHVRTSRLDYESAESSINKSEFKGFLNLFYFSVGMFLMSDPVLRYIETGRFVDPTLAQAMFEDAFILLLNWLQCFIWSFTAFFLYRLFAAGYIGHAVVRILQHSTQSAMIGFCVALCFYQSWPILPCGFTLVIAFLSFMKMHSFTETQLEIHELRERVKEVRSPSAAAAPFAKRPSTEAPGAEPRADASAVEKSQAAEPRTGRRSSKRGSVSSPANEDQQIKALLETARKSQDDATLRALLLTRKTSQEEFLSEILEQDVAAPTLAFYCYYLLCPVLVYEPHYPKGQGFRPLYFINKLFSMIVAMVALYLISTRYLIPTIYSTLGKTVLLTFIRLLWPMLFCYLLVFFILFECICNLLAEITNYGDREFYHDWWNSTTFDEFSRKWNRPVHEFLLRHVYYQSVHKFRLTKFQATVATYFFSALLHELVMAVCFKIIRFWMFSLMMLQIPLIFIGQHYKGTDLGNIIFWASMAVGLPILSIAYGRQYAFKTPREEFSYSITS